MENHLTQTCLLFSINQLKIDYTYKIKNVIFNLRFYYLKPIFLEDNLYKIFLYEDIHSPVSPLRYRLNNDTVEIQRIPKRGQGDGRFSVKSKTGLSNNYLLFLSHLSFAKTAVERHKPRNQFKNSLYKKGTSPIVLFVQIIFFN